MYRNVTIIFLADEENSRYNPDPDSVSGSRFGIRIRNRDLDPARQERKMAHKNIKKCKNFHVLNCWMSSFEG
jgi:hypothetical protein